MTVRKRVLSVPVDNDSPLVSVSQKLTYDGSAFDFLRVYAPRIGDFQTTWKLLSFVAYITADANVSNRFGIFKSLRQDDDQAISPGPKSGAVTASQTLYWAAGGTGYLYGSPLYAETYHHELNPENWKLGGVNYHRMELTGYQAGDVLSVHMLYEYLGKGLNVR